MTHSEQSVWGIDASTRGVALGVAWEKRLACEWVDFPHKLRGPERLARIEDVTKACARRWAEVYEPLMVFVEQPSGRFHNLELIYSCGVVAMSIHAALEDVYEHPVSVLWIPSATWKAHALNNGAATKGAIARWARGLDVEFTMQDEADALGIAVGGRRMVDKGEQVKLSV